jgi:hypothetical protein
MGQILYFTEEKTLFWDLLKANSIFDFLIKFFYS